MRNATGITGSLSEDEKVALVRAKHTPTPAAHEGAEVVLTRAEIEALIDILIWANQKSGGRRTQGAVDSAWTKLAEAHKRTEPGSAGNADGGPEVQA